MKSTNVFFAAFLSCMVLIGAGTSKSVSAASLSFTPVNSQVEVVPLSAWPAIRDSIVNALIGGSNESSSSTVVYVPTPAPPPPPPRHVPHHPPRPHHHGMHHHHPFHR